jgi:hypothetical protein
MATTSYTRYLRLRVASDLTKDAQYNLTRLDLLGASFVRDLSEAVRVRSTTDVQIEPQAADIGGSGSNGTVTIGHLGNQTAILNLNGTTNLNSTVNMTTAAGLKDQGASGTKYLRLKYDSTLANPGADTLADRDLTIDLQGANRTMILSGNLSLAGTLTTAGAITTVGAYPVTLTYQQAGNFTFPNQGTATLVSRDSSDTLTNKGIDADTNTLTNIADASIKTGAAIARAKLASGTAGHVVINDGTTGAFSSEAQLARTRGGTGVSSTATFPTSGTIATDSNLLTFTSKTINAPDNNITNLADANISGSAAIGLSKLAALATSRALVSDGSGVIGVSAVTSTELGYIQGLTSSAQTQIDTKASRALSNLQVTNLAAGDLLVATSGTAMARLAAGANGKTLQMVGGVPTWSTVSQGSPVVSGSYSAPNVLTASDDIETDPSATSQSVYVKGAGGATNLTSNPQVEAGGVDSQTLRIIGTSDADTVRLDDGDGLALNGYIVIRAGTILQLSWDDDNSLWREVSRNG